MPKKPINPTVIINGVKLSRTECNVLASAIQETLESDQKEWHKTLAGIQYTLNYIRLPYPSKAEKTSLKRKVLQKSAP